MRFAITDYLATLVSAFIKPLGNAPAPIDLEQLKDAEIPLKQTNSGIRMKLENDGSIGVPLIWKGSILSSILNMNVNLLLSTTGLIEKALLPGTGRIQ